uniref:Uncharacterized protein TCIL3000_11_12590 n=1 Tax=Trypanosoma congolense (strain IL3000) TaxID=1068625 RepID=G0V291_TRYCI|nr:unnamed protein product [Trypanosoma congolense IL3000]
MYGKTPSVLYAAVFWRRVLLSGRITCVPSPISSASSRSFFSFARQPMKTNCASKDQADGSKDIGDAAWREKLTPQQFRVLRQKATDPPFGIFNEHFEAGTYHCAACRSLLYTSAMKFPCSCGWPAFYDCVPLAVLEVPDSDGVRTEILCNACRGHLGHVFRGEGFGNPPPNERHCVNGSSLVFQPAV